MNPTTIPGLSPEQLFALNLGLMQMSPQRGEGLPQSFNFPAFSGFPLQPNNNLATQVGYPGLTDLHMMQPGMLPLMLQIQQQQQLALGGLFNGTGHVPLVQPYQNGLSLPNMHSGAGSRFVDEEILNLEPAFSRADDEILARGIHQSEGKKSLKEILGSLAGVNGHTSEQWTDYYIKNSTKINAYNLDATVPRTSKTITATTSSSRSIIPKTPRPILKHAPPQKKGSRRYLTPPVPTKAKRGASSRFRDNIAGPSVSQRRSRPLLTAKAQLPAGWSKPYISGSRSPTPPKRFKKLPGGGYKYTDEDMLYFKKVLTCALRKDKRILDTPKALFERLAEGAPHHSALSWRSWLRDNTKAAEIIRRQILEEDEASSADEDEDYSPVDEGNSPESEEKDNEDDESGSESESDDDVSVSLSSSESEGKMRARDAKCLDSYGARNTYLPSDRRGFCKHIAEITLAKWDRLNIKKWLDVEAKFPSHTAKAWAEWYRKNQKDMRRMAKRFEMRNVKRKLAKRSPIVHFASIDANADTKELCAPSNPSEGLAAPRAGPSALQRKRSSDADDEYGERQFAKRSKPFLYSPSSQSNERILSDTCLANPAAVEHPTLNNTVNSGPPFEK